MFAVEPDLISKVTMFLVSNWPPRGAVVDPRQTVVSSRQVQVNDDARTSLRSIDNQAC